MRTLGGLAIGLISLLGVSSTARAAAVDCADKTGSCSVSNTPDDFITCSCNDGGETGGTGGNDWAGLDEAALLEICLAELSSCAAAAESGGPSTSTSVGPSDSGGVTTDEPTTGIGSETGAEGTGSATDTGATGTSGAVETGSGGPVDTGSGGPATGTEGGSGTGAEPTTGGSESSSSGGSATDASATQGEASGGSDGGQNDGGGGGCGCDVGGDSRSGMLGFGLLFGVGLGLRRRR